MIGYDSAFIGTTLALPSFEDEFRFEDYGDDALALLKANIVSVYQAGVSYRIDERLRSHDDLFACLVCYPC